MLQNSKDCENCCVTFMTQTINDILNNHLQFTGAHCWAFQQIFYAHGHKILFANCSVPERLLLRKPTRVPVNVRKPSFWVLLSF